MTRLGTKRPCLLWSLTRFPPNSRLWVISNDQVHGGRGRCHGVAHRILHVDLHSRRDCSIGDAVGGLNGEGQLRRSPDADSELRARGGQSVESQGHPSVPAPGFSILSPENVAMPLTADAVVVPSTTPEPGLALIASVIVFVAVVILVPEALCAST